MLLPGRVVIKPDAPPRMVITTLDPGTLDPAALDTGALEAGI